MSAAQDLKGSTGTDSAAPVCSSWWWLEDTAGRGAHDLWTQESSSSVACQQHKVDELGDTDVTLRQQGEPFPKRRSQPVLLKGIFRGL